MKWQELLAGLALMLVLAGLQKVLPIKSDTEARQKFRELCRREAYRDEGFRRP
jgi:hypothetical protein